MIENNINTELEDRIDDYVEGRLSSTEIDELWAELIQDDYYLDYLKTTANLKKLLAERTEKPARIFALNSTRKWIAAAAAVVVLIGSVAVMNIFTQTSETIQPISSIELDYYRSAEGSATAEEGFETNREAIMLANQGENEAALRLIDEQIERATTVREKAELMITAGSILYNSGRFADAITRFETVLDYDLDDMLVKERSYWYIGNAYFQLNKIPEAKAALEKAYEMNGAYSRVAQSYLKAFSAI